MQQIKSFMDSHPSEIVVVEIRADFSPIGINTCVDKSVVERIDQNEIYWVSDLVTYIENYVGKELIIDNIAIDTKVWELVQNNKRLLLIPNIYTYQANPNNESY